MGDSSKEKKGNAAGFFDGVKVEFKKISWPDKTSITRQTVAVVAISLVLGVIITILDFIVQYGVSFLTM